MKINELIKVLEKFPQDKLIAVMDWRKSLHHDFGEGTSKGIYTEFEFQEFKETDILPSTKPFVAILIKNDDYTDSGKRLV